MSAEIRRRSLGTLLAFMALNAIGGGIYGLAGARGVPLEWLEGSPFRSFLLPSLVLLFVVGGSCGVAAVGVVLRRSFAARATDFAAVILLLWIATQVAVIGFVSWLQPAVAGVALVIGALNRTPPAQ